MKEQKRVFELVKKGIITSEEAVVLLENMANDTVNKPTKEDYESIDEEVKKFESVNELSEKNMHSFEAIDEDDEAGLSDSKEKTSVSNKVSSYFKSVYNSSKIKENYKQTNELVNSTFTHEFYYPEVQATILDFKIANGTVNLMVWDENDLKIDANIKLYGKMKADSNLEAFLERSQIDVSDEKIVFNVPNKRIKADLDVYLPKKIYDHISIKLLNGDISLSEIKANDLFIKSTNGDKILKEIEATMLELEGVNGDVNITNSQINDVISEVVNGNSEMTGSFQALTISKVNGDFLLKPKGNTLKNVDTKINVGTIRVVLPVETGLEAQLKTNFGSIKQKLANIEIVRERKEKTTQQLQLRRNVEGKETIHLRLNSTTGNIYLKDEEQ